MADVFPQDRLPPQSREAEKGVIGSVLRDNTSLNDVQTIIRVDNFYYDAHQKIFQAISDLYNDGKPVDLVILFETLKARKQLEDVGGPAYLGELWESAPTAANAEYYARIVRDKAVVRNLIHTNTELLRDAYDGVMSADELLGLAERKILEIAEKGTTGETFTLDKTLTEAFNRIDARVGQAHLSVSGIPTGYVDLDNILAGLQNNELIILAARPSVGKCLAGSTEVVQPDGSMKTMAEIVESKRGDVLTLGSDWKFQASPIQHFVDDGMKPVYRVRTRLGRVVETTASHPFRTLKGWIPLAGLAVGARIAVPRSLPIYGNEPMRDCEAKLLGYLIGDGGLTDTTPEFTNANPRLREDFCDASRKFGGVQLRLENGANGRTETLLVAGNKSAISAERQVFARILRHAFKVRGTSRKIAKTLAVSPSLVTQWTKGRTVPSPEAFVRICKIVALPVEADTLEGLRSRTRNPMTQWLRKLGLWGCNSRGKFVPAVIFRAPRFQVALFLNRLFATDGWATVLGEGQTQIGYASVSEKLSRQVQHLLLRFGILASLRERRILYRGVRRTAWQLDITNQESIRTFARDIGIFGKEEALTNVLLQLNTKRAKACRDTIPAEVWTYLDAARKGRSWASIAEAAGLDPRTNMHVGTRGLSRPRLLKLARALGATALGALAESDVYWDRIVSIEALGPQRVFDLTIPATHNFVANDICVHNTAFALNIARHIIVEERLPVFFVSLEQSRIELAERLLCSQARVNSHNLRKGQLSSDDMQKLIAAGDQLKGPRNNPVKLFIDDSPAQGMLRISANARRLKLRHDIRLVIIDYLQLIDPENRRDPRQEQVAQISRRLKFLARELQIPVIALAQVNRASEDRQDHKPRLSDLRESGSIEQDADTCMLLHRPGKFDGGQEDNILEVIIAKQRNGPTGDVTLTYIKEYMRYENYDPGTGGGGFGGG